MSVQYDIIEIKKMHRCTSCERSFYCNYSRNVISTDKRYLDAMPK